MCLSEDREGFVYLLLYQSNGGPKVRVDYYLDRDFFTETYVLFQLELLKSLI